MRARYVLALLFGCVFGAAPAAAQQNTDIRYDIAARSSTRLTNTPEHEYSPPWPDARTRRLLVVFALFIKSMNGRRALAGAQW